MSCYGCLQNAYRVSGFFSSLSGMHHAGWNGKGESSPHTSVFVPLCIGVGDIPYSHPKGKED